MRFLCVYKQMGPEHDLPPDPTEMGAMGRLIEDMSKAGVLLATEGCQPTARAARVRVEAGMFQVTDGPFPEARDRVGGFCMLQVKSKAEAVEWGKRFLSIVKVGQTEIYQLQDMAPAA
jgi:hypothetical protein